MEYGLHSLTTVPLSANEIGSFIFIVAVGLLFMWGERGLSESKTK